MIVRRRLSAGNRSRADRHVRHGAHASVPCGAGRAEAGLCAESPLGQTSPASPDCR